MDKKDLKMLYMIAGILAVSFIVISIGILLFMGYMYVGVLTAHKASSIAIIGGADGPSTMFYARSFSDGLSLASLSLCMLIASLSLIIALKKYRK